jgi:hypothetical protein
MPRATRVERAGLVYHVLNRGVGRQQIFFSERDYQPEELSRLRRSVDRGCPYGTTPWPSAAVTRFGLESTVRSRGRPRKQAQKGS